MSQLERCWCTQEFHLYVFMRLTSLAHQSYPPLPRHKSGLHTVLAHIIIWIIIPLLVQALLIFSRPPSGMKKWLSLVPGVCVCDWSGAWTHTIWIHGRMLKPGTQVDDISTSKYPKFHQPINELRCPYDHFETNIFFFKLVSTLH